MKKYILTIIALSFINLYSQSIPTLYNDSIQIQEILNDSIICNDKKICNSVKKQLDLFCKCNFKLTRNINKSDIESGNRRGGDFEIIKTTKFYIIKYEYGGVALSTQLLIFRWDKNRYVYFLNLEALNHLNWRESLKRILYERVKSEI